MVQLFKIRYTRRHEELRQLKKIRNAIDYALAKRNGEDPAMPSLRIHDRTSEAFQRASGRKSLKEELTKAKTKQQDREQQRNRNTVRDSQKDRSRN